jgi:hypothetical protein
MYYKAQGVLVEIKKQYTGRSKACKTNTTTAQPTLEQQITVQSKNNAKQKRKQQHQTQKGPPEANNTAAPSQKQSTHNHR